jgi:hypothetical protein
LSQPTTIFIFLILIYLEVGPNLLGLTFLLF